MKKFVLGIFTAAAALSMFVGCDSASEEERFLQAQKKFDNFTVTVTFTEQGEDPFSHKLEVKDTACKVTVQHETATAYYYYKEQFGYIYYYQGASRGWTQTSFSCIGDILGTEGCGYVAFFQQFFYDDFIKDGDYLRMTDSAIIHYGNLLGNYMNLSSAKLKLNGSCFASATAVIQSGPYRTQLDYKFSSFGTTHFTLPD